MKETIKDIVVVIGVILAGISLGALSLLVRALPFVVAGCILFWIFG